MNELRSAGYLHVALVGARSRTRRNERNARQIGVAGGAACFVLALVLSRRRRRGAAGALE